MNRRGFTLVELLIALALVGFLLVAMNTFLFSMGELWGRQGEQRLFELHVRNAMRFIQGELNRASLPPAAGEKDMIVREMRTTVGFNENLFSFILPGGSRLCDWPDGRALPDVFCALAVRERKGLFFLWHSTLEERFEQDPPRETRISPWVTGIQYDYYDRELKNWKTEREPRRRIGEANTKPARLRLTFEYSGMKREVVLAVPAAVEGLPLL